MNPALHKLFSEVRKGNFISRNRVYLTTKRIGGEGLGENNIDSCTL